MDVTCFKREKIDSKLAIKICKRILDDTLKSDSERDCLDCNSVECFACPLNKSYYLDNKDRCGMNKTMDEKIATIRALISFLCGGYDKEIEL